MSHVLLCGVQNHDQLFQRYETCASIANVCVHALRARTHKLPPYLCACNADCPRTGISVTAGHDCLFEESYPVLLNATMNRLMAATGVR